MTSGTLVHIHNCHPDVDWGFGVYVLEGGEAWVQYTIASYLVYSGRFVLREALWTFTGPALPWEAGK